MTSTCNSINVPFTSPCATLASQSLLGQPGRYRSSCPLPHPASSKPASSSYTPHSQKPPWKDPQYHHSSTSQYSPHHPHESLLNQEAHRCHQQHEHSPAIPSRPVQPSETAPTGSHHSSYQQPMYSYLTALLCVETL